MTIKMKHLSLAILAILANPAHADTQKHRFDIPPQPLGSALQTLATQSGSQMLYAEQSAAGRQSQGLSGYYTTQEAADKLLAGSGLVHSVADSGTVTVKPTEATGETTLEKVTVEADYDPYDPTNTADPYNKSYSATNATTATKTDTSLMETPISVQVLPQAVLKDQQVIRLEDALKNVPGVQGAFNAGRSYNIFTLRGFNTGPTDTTLSTSTYREGFRLSGWPMPTVNLDRIEVLKGPAAMLYGRVQPGGIINAVTKDPLATPYYSVQQQFGSYDLYRTTLDTTGPIAGNKNLLYRFNAEYLKTNSFRDFLHDEQVVIAPTLTWKITPATTAELEFEYRFQDSPLDYGIPVLDGQTRPANIPISRWLGDGKHVEFGRRDDFLVDLDLNHRFNEDWSLRFKGTYAHTDRRSFQIYGWGFEQDTAGNPTSLLQRFVYNDTSDRDFWYSNVDLTGHFSTWGVKHTVLVGADYYDQWYRDVFDGATQLPSIDITNPIYGVVNPASVNALLNPGQPNRTDWRSINKWWGVYIQDQIDITKQLHVLLGARYDDAKWVYDITGTPTTNNSDWSPKYGLVYQPWDWLSLYGHYAESFGSNNGRSSSPSRTPFEPELAKEYELGFKTEFFDGKLTGNVAYYELTKSNILSPDNQTPDPFDSIAIGKARSRGVEIDVTGQLTDKLSIIGSYAYTDARITQDNNSSILGRRLPNVGEHTASLWGKYDITNNFTIGTGAYVASEREGDNENSFQLPGYVRWDMMAAYHVDVGKSKITAQINVNNILDKQYYAGTRNNRFWISPSDPLTLFGSLKLEF